MPWETERKHWYSLCQRMFCLWSLVGVLWCHIIFKSLSHFVFISVYYESVCSKFIDSYAAVQLSQHHLQSQGEKPERIKENQVFLGFFLRGFFPFPFKYYISPEFCQWSLFFSPGTLPVSSTVILRWWLPNTQFCENISFELETYICHDIR